MHCPAGTDHVLVGAGDGPCTILALGSRTSGEIVYPRSELALRHGAGVETETPEPKVAYAAYGEDRPVGFRQGWLPG